MKSLADRMIQLRDRCLRCWTQEFSDIFPQYINIKIASDELKRYGNPDCTCNGDSRIIFLRDKASE